MDEILTQTDGAIFRIQLNRAQKRNAFNLAMYAAVSDALRQANEDSSVRVVIVHGVGDAFSAGNDIDDFINHPPGDGESPAKKMMDALAAFEKPLVAAVHGSAIGSGATMLTYFDFVYADKGTRFLYPFINLAVVPEFGTSFSLPSQVGYLRAAEIVFLGHPFAADQALAMGLVTKIAADEDVLAVALKTAEELAKKPAAALMACKRLLRKPTKPLVAQAVEDELVEFSEKVRAPDAREAFTAFLEKRAPKFAGS